MLVDSTGSLCYELFITILIDRETIIITLMNMFPTWALERVAYWTMFALIVLSIEKMVKDMNLDFIRICPRTEKVIAAITLIGIASLFLWVFIH